MGDPRRRRKSKGKKGEEKRRGSKKGKKVGACTLEYTSE
jgi:hypothetical protein